MDIVKCVTLMFWKNPNLYTFEQFCLKQLHKETFTYKLEAKEAQISNLESLGTIVPMLDPMLAEARME